MRQLNPEAKEGAIRGNLIITGPSRLAREGLKPVLRKWRFVVHGEGRDLIEARHRIDSAIIPDVAIGIMTGAADIDVALAQLPEVRSDFRDLRYVMVADVSNDDVLRAIRAGVDAVLSSDISPRLLLSSLELVLLGQRLFPAALPLQLLMERRSALPEPTERISIPGRRGEDSSNILIEAPPPRPPGSAAQVTSPLIGIEAVTSAGPLILSDRESQILRCLVNGDPNKVIARHLGIAETTVKVHIKGLLRKVRASNRTQAAIWALNNCFHDARA